MKRMGYSAVNMLYGLRRCTYRLYEACIEYMEDCYMLSKQRPSNYFPGIAEKLEMREIIKICKGLKDAKLRPELEAWVFDELGIKINAGDDDGIAG